MTWWRSGRRMTEDCRRVLAEARKSAWSLGTPVVSPHHVLLALLQPGDNFGARVLDGVCRMRALVTLIRNATEERHGEGVACRPKFSADTRVLLDIARGEALSLGHACIGTEHFLLAFLRDRDSPLVSALHELGYDRSRILEDIRDLLCIHTAEQTELPAQFLPIPRFRKEDFPPDVRSDSFLDFLMRTDASVGDDLYALWGFVQRAWKRGPATRQQFAQYIIEECTAAIRAMQLPEDQDSA